MWDICSLPAEHRHRDRQHHHSIYQFELHHHSSNSTNIARHSHSLAQKFYQLHHQLPILPTNSTFNSASTTSGHSPCELTAQPIIQPDSGFTANKLKSSAKSEPSTMTRNINQITNYYHKQRNQNLVLKTQDLDSNSPSWCLRAG